MSESAMIKHDKEDVVPPTPMSRQESARSTKELFRSLSQRNMSMTSNPPELENKEGWKADICRFIHKRPGKFCMTYCAALFFMTGIGLGVFPFLDGDADISNPNDPANVATDAIRLARDDFEVNFDNDDFDPDTQILLAYFWDDSSQEDSDIINAKNLKDICEFEQSMFPRFNPDFLECDIENTEDVCVSAVDVSGAFQSRSVAGVFYGRILGNNTFTFEDCPLLEEADVEAERELFYAEMSESELLLFRNGFFTNSQSKATKLRSAMGVGTPTEDDTKDVLLDLEGDLFDACGTSNSFFRSAYRKTCSLGDVRAIFFISEVLGDEFGRLIIADASWIVLSFIFVSIWMAFYSKSKFLTLCFMSYIFATVTTAIFIYKAIIQIRYFDFLQILAIFLIIGIGADSDFVVLDAWRQSRDIFVSEKTKDVDEDIIELRRLVYTYERSTVTVFNTALTTFCAFAFTAITAITPISAFGIYAALCVLVTYIFCLTIVPATLIVYHRRWGRDAENKRQEEKEARAGTDDEELGLWDKVVEITYVPLLWSQHKVLVGIFLGLGALGIAGTTQISELTETENFLPSDHMIQEFIDTTDFLGAAADEFSTLTLTFGLTGVDRDIFSRYSGDEDEYNENVNYDDNFQLDLTTLNAIADVCDDILLEPCSQRNICRDFTLMVLPEDASYQHNCAVKDFSAFHSDTFGTSLLASDDNFVGDLDTAVIAQRLRQFLDSTTDEDILESFGVEDDRVRFVTVEFRTAITLFNPGPFIRPVKRQMEAFVDREEAEHGFSKILFASEIYVTEASGRALLNNAIQGLAITIPVVYVIMMRATNNVVLATFCVTTIGFIILCVMGMIAVPLGWELGTAESIITIMIVGLSVDYAVHLVHMYIYAGETMGIDTREERAAFSAKAISQTVVAGALTTIGAGAFLLGTQILFFFKMGLLLTITITLSLFYSLFFLMGLMVWIGPERDFANIDVFIKKMRSRWEEYRTL